MEKKSKLERRNSVSRMLFAGISVLLQVCWVTFQFLQFYEYTVVARGIVWILALLLVLNVCDREINAAMKLSWVIVILAVPVFGICLYVMFGRSGLLNPMLKKFNTVHEPISHYISQNPETQNRLREKDPAAANLSGYLWKYGEFPVYDQIPTVFFGQSEPGYESMIRDLEHAESFILMEYHAIEDAAAFAPIKKILFEKAEKGVEIRILYDDVGSMSFIGSPFAREMTNHGIYCRSFNPMRPLPIIFMNNRDHRKITVIDGRIAYTGGYNLADEYFGITHPYGHWKDSGIRIEGDAVDSFTAMFLEMWNVVRRTDLDYDKFFRRLPDRQSEAGADMKKSAGNDLTEPEESSESDLEKPEESSEATPAEQEESNGNDLTDPETGFVQPYGDSPLDGEPIGENVYLNIIKNAKDYVYFTTPYLIITDEMKRELTLAAKRGVDVRIITPRIPDKKTIFRVTRSNYHPLVRDGVRIYEYVPGFCHSKMCVSDDMIATVGTINLDYRSLYLHFENGVLLYRTKTVSEVLQNVTDTLALSEEVTDQYMKKKDVVFRLEECMLKLLAPLF